MEIEGNWIRQTFVFPARCPKTLQSPTICSATIKIISGFSSWKLEVMGVIEWESVGSMIGLRIGRSIKFRTSRKADAE